MIPLNEEAAIVNAIEITKAICSNPNTDIPLNKESAENIAEFIGILEAKFLALEED